eukprot:5117259-Amphidinium_carterae.1
MEDNSATHTYAFVKYLAAHQEAPGRNELGGSNEFHEHWMRNFQLTTVNPHLESNRVIWGWLKLRINNRRANLEVD